MEDFVNGINAAMGMHLYLQVAIPAGYLGYLIARSGISQHDRPISIIFLSLFFALISIVGWRVSGKYFSLYPQLFAAVLLPLVAALLWRKWFHQLVMCGLHKLRISNSSQFPDVWTEIIENTCVGVSQVTVFLKSGTALTCDFIYDFEDAPLNLMRRDKEGNIAFYVTGERPVGTDNFIKTKDEAKAEVDGMTHYRLTYVPKDEIERVEFVTNRPTSSQVAE